MSNGGGVTVAYTDNTAVWNKDTVNMYDINIFIEGEYAHMWQSFMRRFRTVQYADDMLALAIKEGLKQLGGLASFDEDWENQGFPGAEEVKG